MRDRKEMIQNVFLNSQGRDVIKFKLHESLEVEGILEKFGSAGTANVVAVKVEGYDFQFILPYDTLVTISTPELGDEARPYKIKPEQYEPKMMNRWVDLDAGDDGVQRGLLTGYEAHHKLIRQQNENKIQIRTQFNFLTGPYIVSYKYV